MVNVWSLPEMASSGKSKVTLDMTTKVADAILTGVQFAHPLGRSSTSNLLCATYDSHTLRVFLGM